MNLKKGKTLYEIKLKNYISPIFIRNRPSSDYDVLCQVIFEAEYETASTALELNFQPRETITIIDAGANIGLTSRFFAERFPLSVIYALEPDSQNFKMLLKNVENFGTIKPLQKALSAAQGKRFDIGKSMRDGADWAKTTQESSSGKIPGVTLQELLNEGTGFFDLLKIDIEGAERFIFDKQASQDFLDKTRVLVIEIHDEFNIRASIYQILRKRGFNVLEQGELTIGINMKLIDLEP
ncbi:MAG: FkbM family methyltransferase [Bacteroidota bacterium]|uniref:FkbM family methyltransferase n=1 Tax=Leeuwenhoekiella palythoae TaxID=573501 RepID=UPI002EC4ABD9|nr:FkbM family methyltransferase [Bacteroidota bacterium]